jgi:hypothetical protein
MITVKTTPVYVVEAQHEDQLHYWAAATPPENATRAVRQQLGEDWDVRLTPYVLDKTHVATLGLAPGRVRRIKFIQGRDLIE